MGRFSCEKFPSIFTPNLVLFVGFVDSQSHPSPDSGIPSVAKVSVLQYYNTLGISAIVMPPWGDLTQAPSAKISSATTSTWIYICYSPGKHSQLLFISLVQAVRVFWVLFFNLIFTVFFFHYNLVPLYHPLPAITIPLPMSMSTFPFCSVLPLPNHSPQWLSSALHL